MDDEEAKVIFCSRGGYGAVHLIGKLDFTKFRQHPKWLIGFSDITASIICSSRMASRRCTPPWRAISQ